uniref:Shisa family member 9a n=1 Tax=Xiphophorus couchianus TaxID=32473 RepID=A0A3B5L279_9TELE
MGGRFFLLAFLLLKLTALVCKADGEPGLLGGFVMIATSNGSREEDGAPEEAPHTEEQCRGYYDVMGQWDPPFVCKTGDYLYCCGTCGFRFCCSLKHSRLDQSTCKNYDTPVWMKTGQTPYKKMNKMHDSTKDKTNLIVYIICGVVAIMALVGIFTKLGLEKAHRPQRENMSSQLNNNVAASSSVGPQHPYPALSQLAQAYEQQQQQQNADLNKYASLKAVGEWQLQPSTRLGASSLAHMVGTMPGGMSRAVETAFGSSSATMGRPFAYSSNTIAGHAAGFGIKGWDGTETVGRRKSYGHKRPQCTVLEPNQLHGTRGQSHSQHFLPTQPYFVTNSKTEVTV